MMFLRINQTKLWVNLTKCEGRGADIRFFFLFLWSDLTLWKNLKPKLFIINNKNYEEEPIQIGCLFGSGSPLGLSV